MSSKKWIFSRACAFVLIVVSTTAFSATTKVGNGDDGKDLEGAEPIQSGILFETRKEAVQQLKALNIQGVYGLGNVVPELERSELIMATRDVHPISVEGEWETSDDRHSVFARTFAEPYAPTRFFPAALKLSRQQLIALHTHEALHRALPPGIREDEEKVAMLTMALTSPSATFDRVNRIAVKTLQPHETLPASRVASTTLAQPELPVSLPPSAKSQLSVNHTTYSGFQDSHVGTMNVEQLGLKFSPVGVHTVGGLPFESVVALDGNLVTFGRGSFAGPLSATAKFPVYYNSDMDFGPLVHVSTKSMQSDYRWTIPDREIYTVGAFLDNRSATRYFSTAITYTLPGSWNETAGSQTLVSVNFNPILSMQFRTGIRVGRFSFGGIFDVHHSQGYTNSDTQAPYYTPPMANRDAFTILRAGPELNWDFGRVKASLAAEIKLNQEDATLDDLGDFAGHGSGTSSANVSLTYEM